MIFVAEIMIIIILLVKVKLVAHPTPGTRSAPRGEEGGGGEGAVPVRSETKRNFTINRNIL